MQPAHWSQAERHDKITRETLDHFEKWYGPYPYKTLTVVDPELVVLGGGIGQAPGFAAAVTAELRGLAPVLPEVRVSALGTDVVVDGCLASGAELAWARLIRLTAEAG